MALNQSKSPKYCLGLLFDLVKNVLNGLKEQEIAQKK